MRFSSFRREKQRNKSWNRYSFESVFLIPSMKKYFFPWVKIASRLCHVTWNNLYIGSEGYPDRGNTCLINVKTFSWLRAIIAKPIRYLIMSRVVSWDHCWGLNRDPTRFNKHTLDVLSIRVHIFTSRSKYNFRSSIIKKRKRNNLFWKAFYKNNCWQDSKNNK